MVLNKFFLCLKQFHKSSSGFNKNFPSLFVTTLVDFFHSHGVIFCGGNLALRKYTAEDKSSRTRKPVTAGRTGQFAESLSEGFLVFDSKVCLYASLDNLRTRQVLVRSPKKAFLITMEPRFNKGPEGWQKNVQFNEVLLWIEIILHIFHIARLRQGCHLDLSHL